MSNSCDAPQIAEVEGAIRNPADPHHFMVVQPVEGYVQIDIDGVGVAKTHRALLVIEIGSHVYQPRYYVPKADVIVDLTETNRTTHCPLKGHASYFSLNGNEVGWCYNTFDFAEILEGQISFASENLSILLGGKQSTDPSKTDGPAP